MAQQSPLISIPRKSTTDIDWTGPLRTIIAQSYGEDPNTYTEECSVLSRCRQDATRGAGSDQTARDLLYKYFGQLELLELRFSEIKVSFTWNDAFTTKPTTQTSLAFEKASIIHLLSAVLSQLASSGSRADPEGVKRAYFSTRASSGMLTYINENFLHAPSTDLSREVVHLLIGIMSAQSSEIFTEKLVEEKKAPTLVARAANQAAAQYNTVVDEIKEFQGKGIVDKNWLSIIQIKAKFFISVAQYYRSIADGAAGKHGAALVRLKLADTAAQEAQRLAYTFTYTFVSSATPTLPHDAASSLHEITKAHATLCSEAKTQAQKDNDLIYHEILPSEASLPAIDKLPAAAPITIQEIFSNPDVSKLIGPDIFGKLVPLAVHESASVYSEEKAKVVRQEVERCDMNQGEIQAGLEHLGFPRLIRIWQNLAEDDDSGNGDVEISGVLARLAEEVRNGGSLDHLVGSLDSQRERCERELRELNGQLDTENRECERARAKYSPQFTQPPSGQQTAHLRNNISSNLGTLSTAATSDAHVVQLSRSIQADIALLSSGRDRLEQIAKDVAAGKQAPQQPTANMSLLDLEDDYGVSEPKKGGLDEGERENLRKAVSEATEKMDRMGKIRRERDEVLKDLKEKIQNDDVSSLLMLNRRTQGVEPQLFATELEKFRPYQGRLAAAVQASQSILQELEMLAGQVERGKGVKERQRAQKDRARRVREWETQLRNAGETYNEVRAALGKGTSYYESLQTVIADLRREVKNFVSSRDAERSRMVSEIETRQRLGSSPPPVPSSHTPSRGLESQMAGMSLGSGGRSYGSTSPYSSPAPPQPPRPYGGSAYPPPPTQASTPSFPPPPPSAPKTSSYSSSAYPSIPSSYAPAPPPSAQAYPSHLPPSQAPAQRQGSYGYPPSTSSSSSSSAPYMPPPPPSRAAQASMYGAPPPSQQYPAPPASSGYQSPSYQHPPPSQYQPPSQAYPSASHSPTHTTSPPPTGYPSYGAQPPHQPYSPYPAPPSSGPPQPQHNAYQPPPPGPPQPHHNTYHPPPPPPQGYGGYQPPQSGYPYR